MKKSMIKKILSICATLALAFVAVVTFTAPNKQISANAEETEVPDTSTWVEVTPQIGDKIAGVWFRYYLNETSTSERIFIFENYDVINEVTTSEFVDPGEYALNIMSTGSLYVSKPVPSIANKNDIYIDFCIAQGEKTAVREAINSQAQKIEYTYIILNSETSIKSIISTNLKVLKDPTTPDEPTNPGDSTETPDEPTNPGDGTGTPDVGTETPDDGTEEPKDATTDKVANWLNDTFGMNTNGNTVGAIAIVLAGVLIIKFVLGKK